MKENNSNENMQVITGRGNSKITYKPRRITNE